MLRRLGCDVEVFQRSREPLRGRGAGIVIPVSLLEELISRELLPSDYPACRYSRRRWIVADGSPRGRVAWESPMSAATNNWAVLWRALRAAVPDECYHAGKTVTAVRQEREGATITLADGETHLEDLVVGADGYRSTVRRLLHVDASPTIAPYVLWRGDYEESRAPDPGLIQDSDAAAASFTLPFSGGHGVIYLIPGENGSTTVGERRVNWAVYTAIPPCVDPSETPSLRADEIPRKAHAFFEEAIDRGLPPKSAELVRTSTRDEIWIQPIYDKLAERYAEGRVMLIGDGGNVARPHTASGATKAFQDAPTLGRLGAAHDEWPAILAAYDAERAPEGERLVRMGRRLGRAQVESPPPWGRMTPADFKEWSAQMTAGRAHHLFSDD
jgi:2-polyprenyl-6-methoxyphenol hydroxylase-like FAD-dependent oxidoreductase